MNAAQRAGGRGSSVPCQGGWWALSWKWLKGAFLQGRLTTLVLDGERLSTAPTVCMGGRSPWLPPERLQSQGLGCVSGLTSILDSISLRRPPLTQRDFNFQLKKEKVGVSPGGERGRGGSLKGHVNLYSQWPQKEECSQGLPFPSPRSLAPMHR